MRILKPFLYLLFISIVVSAQAQSTDEELSTNDPAPRTGWNFGALPALGYDSNLGLLYGGIVSVFDYGNGDRSPDYDQNIYFQVSGYTKGGLDVIWAYDSFTLLPNKQFTARASYNRNRSNPFYGFNGNQMVYNADWEQSDHADYQSNIFYKNDRELAKVDLFVQDFIGDSHVKWLAGFDGAYYNVDTVDYQYLNDKKADDEEKIPSVAGLYNRYIDWGVISPDTDQKGFDNSFKVGLIYDSRDRITNPMKGTWTEVLYRYAPSFLGNDESFSRFSIIHKQYFSIVEERLSFAYRLWYEAAFGDVPAYSRQYLTATNYYEGMGGATTLRGVLMNRVVGKQVGVANVELRWKAYYFDAIGQKFYLGLNAFVDAGYIFEGYDLDLSGVPEAEKAIYFNQEYKELIPAGGLGLKLAMNENFVVSADYAVSFDKNYGNSGLYVLIGYMF